MTLSITWYPSWHTGAPRRSNFKIKKVIHHEGERYKFCYKCWGWTKKLVACGECFADDSDKPPYNAFMRTRRQTTNDHRSNMKEQYTRLQNRVWITNVNQMLKFARFITDNKLSVIMAYPPLRHKIMQYVHEGISKMWCTPPLSWP